MNAHRLILLAVVALRVPVARAQHPHGATTTPDSATSLFITAARAGTVRYRDRSTAIADGYRRVGPDLPAMGEHWLNIRLVLADSIDAKHPSVLIYIASPAGPVLAGAAYTRLLGAADSYPDFPRGLGAWHDHSGFVDDEALPMHHARHAATVRDTARLTRLGILHLWMWQENPDGPWTADNWSLPFVRAGLRPPSAPSTGAAGRALTLATDSGRYYRQVIAAAAKLDDAEVLRLERVLAPAATRARAISFTPGGEPTPAEREQLRAIWESLWPAIQQTLTPAAVANLDDLRRMWW